MVTKYKITINEARLFEINHINEYYHKLTTPTYIYIKYV